MISFESNVPPSSFLMKKSLIAGILVIASAMFLSAAENELRVAPHDLNFQPAATTDILTLTAPVSNTVEAVRWNNIIIRLPQAVKFQPGLVLVGEAHITSDSPASHIALVVKGNHQKGSYAREKISNGTVKFEFPLSKLEPDTKAANKAPLSPEDDVLELRLFVSFPDAVNSTFTLDSLTLTLSK